ncbi:MAG: NAD+ synthase [Desulfohalobiaceae bacterium]|nr:NAD+ synthase [Desulfohalobiaceae bacterium]
MEVRMRIGLAQINPTVGAFADNCERILSSAERAAREGCDLVVLPEMALVGYPPQDLLGREGFVSGSLAYWQRIAQASRDVAILCGVVARNESGAGKPYQNAALFCSGGRVERVLARRLLPSYDVFDEERYFEPGTEPALLDFRGLRLGVTICEDIWTREPFGPGQRYRNDPVRDVAEHDPDLLINISASPYHVGKQEKINELLALHAREHKIPLLYVNQVGGNDELVFHGHSMVVDRQGEVTNLGADFAEDLVLWDSDGSREKALSGRPATQEAEILKALELGLRDYIGKCGFSQVVLGLSGGIDSAVTACVAVSALGPENVRTLALPGPYNDPASLELSRELAANLGTDFEVIPIDELYHGANQALAPIFQGRGRDVTEENIQARLRGLLLMAVSNKFGELLLNTGNKSELAVGYCTLYGDMNGGISVLGDVPKTTVYGIARLINEEHGWIPEGIISRPPSAELSPGQKDEDSLPPYRTLDDILYAYLEENLSLEEIVARGYDPRTVEWVAHRIYSNEYKQRQGPPVLRVTSKAFRMGRRLPIAHGYRETGSR